MESAHDIARSLPQTLPALAGLFIRQGRDETELARLREAHRLAQEIFSGQYRPSGKPFLCHLVGTAAALTVSGARIDLIVAGLLHAGYTCGDWGDALPTMNDAKRAKLRARVGAEAEDLVARYTRLEWYLQPVTDIVFERLDRGERDTLALRLANEVDDHLDLGVLYTSMAESKRKLAAEALPLWVRFARDLGYEPLAELLIATVEPVIAGELPAPLRSRRRNSYLIAPLSHQPRALAILRKKVWAGGDRARNLAARVRAILKV